MCEGFDSRMREVMALFYLINLVALVGYAVLLFCLCDGSGLEV